MADEARLLVALNIEGETGDDLIPATALLVDRDDLGAAADLGVDGDWRWEADLVEVVGIVWADIGRSRATITAPCRGRQPLDTTRPATYASAMSAPTFDSYGINSARSPLA